MFQCVGNTVDNVRIAFPARERKGIHVADPRSPVAIVFRIVVVVNLTAGHNAWIRVSTSAEVPGKTANLISVIEGPAHIAIRRWWWWWRRRYAAMRRVESAIVQLRLSAVTINRVQRTLQCIVVCRHSTENAYRIAFDEPAGLGLDYVVVQSRFRIKMGCGVPAPACAMPAW